MSEEIQNASPKTKNKRKAPIVIGIVAAVLVVAGAGFWVWHEQPSFCSAICHTPMDAYGKTYDGSQDFQGNKLDATEASSMLAYQHANLAGTTCMGCHVPTLSEQVGEGMAWLSGDYYITGTNANGDALIETRSLSDLTEARGVAKTEFCQNDTCHADTPDRESLIAKTEYLGTYNPHLMRHGEVDCGMCHKGHSQSVNVCTECHASAPVPDGWLDMASAQEKGVIPTVNK